MNHAIKELIHRPGNVRARLLGCFLVFGVLFSAQAQQAPPAGAVLGLPRIDEPQFAPPDAERVELGRRLFFDKRFSADGTIGCTSCHDPQRAFVDGKARAVGIDGRRGTRNAPSLFNVAFQSTLFWDGRASGLETQARAPLLNQSEHGLHDEQQVLKIAKSDAQYQAAFAKAFPQQADISIEEVAGALAAYERTLLAGASPFDRYYFAGEKGAISAAAVRGLDLFQGRARCTNCHVIGEHSALFTDQDFHPSTTGLGSEVNAALPALTKRVLEARAGKGLKTLDQMITDDPKIAALGRFVSTLNPADIGKFKTPSLRNVAVTGPYMHDGSFNSLALVVETELYVRGAAMNYPIVLTQSEQQDLLEFLKALTSPAVVADGAPHAAAE